MNTVNSGAVAMATTDENWITVIALQTAFGLTHALIQVANGAAFDWSVDGGTTAHRVLADPAGNPLRLALEGLLIVDQPIKIRRASATNLSGVWASAW